MCGIAGVYHSHGQPARREMVQHMTDALSHRGPDDGGFYVDESVALGHRRLSIIDPAGGRQPISTRDRSLTLVFNGEIYNYRELQAELRALGHGFDTASDSEVLLKCWLQWGEGALHRLRGMYAFAIWERERRRLVLARDRIGIKPLYYATMADGTVLFGSELKALLASGRVRPELDPCSVEDYFAYGYVPEPRSIFRGIAKLPPGHWVSAEPGRGAGVPRQYWDLRFAASMSRGRAGLEQELAARIDDAVSSHLVSDVPVGAFLSGGVDSSTVVASMAGQRSGEVSTFSVGFTASERDESRFARAVAEHCRTVHHTQILNDAQPPQLNGLSAIYDEPFADNSALPTEMLCRLAREQVKVALSGDGGDENFAGYDRYLFHVRKQRMREWLPPGLRAPLFGALGRAYPSLVWAPRVLRAKTTFETLAQGPVESFARSAMITTRRQRERITRCSFRKALGGYDAVDVLHRHARCGPAEDPLALVQYLDFKTYLPGDILTKVDRASMRHGLEVRVPLLDHELVEWVAQEVPSREKLRGGEGKHLLKQVARARLPREVIERRKMGFDVPLSRWLKGVFRDRVTSLVRNERLMDSGLFEPTGIAACAREHLSGAADHSELLWALLVFEEFHGSIVEPPVPHGAIAC